LVKAWVTRVRARRGRGKVQKQKMAKARDATASKEGKREAASVKVHM
jgi:hypothetical protein